MQKHENRDLFFFNTSLWKGSISKCYFLADLLQIKSEAPAWFSHVRPKWQMHKRLSSLCVFPSTKPPFLALLLPGQLTSYNFQLVLAHERYPRDRRLVGKKLGYQPELFVEHPVGTSVFWEHTSFRLLPTARRSVNLWVLSICYWALTLPTPVW